MINIIKKKLDNYLEFDSDLLFKNGDKLIRIFGGSIRDIIAGFDYIKDVDILVGYKSFHYLENVLSFNGYTLMDSLIPKDLSSLYSNINVISEPHTWIKGVKIVQLIRPRFSSVNSFLYNDVHYYKNFFDLISNVDISCCGVSYDGYNLYENYKNAILHCLSLKFEVNTSAKMYSKDRIYHRIIKLEGRGWREISGLLDKRDIILSTLLEENKIEYIIE